VLKHDEVNSSPPPGIFSGNLPDSSAQTQFLQKARGDPAADVRITTASRGSTPST
jgi:hypothetical protein